MTSDQSVSGQEAPVSTSGDSSARLIRVALVGIFIVASVSALYFARDFFMPVVLAFLMALTLTPVVRLLRRHGIPAALSATLLVVLSGASIGFIGYVMSGPVVELVADAPKIGRELTLRLSQISRPLEQLKEASEQVEQIADQTGEPGTQKVVLAQPGIVSRAAGNLVSAGTTVAITFVLSLFLLASGTLFYEKIIQSFTRLSEKKRALRVVYDVEREISRYLFTVAIINTAVGVAVGLGLWALGLPNALVFGVIAGVLNFLPYIGALLTALVVAAVSLVTFDSLAYALLAPGYVVLVNTIEGQFITPLVVGRRLEINAVAIFIAVAFWSWLWGVIGALIAVPLLVIIKVFCDNFEGLHNVGNFLSAQQTIDNGQEEEQPAVAPAAGTTAAK